MSYREVLSKAPTFLKKRFSSLRDYVSAILYTQAKIFINKEDEYWNSKNNIRRSEVIDQATLVYFIALQKTFYVRTTEASIETLSCFQKFDVPEFVIGSATFSDSSEDILRGKQLADELMQYITDERVRSLVDTIKYASDVVEHFEHSFLHLSYLFDQAQTQQDLLDFFGEHHAQLDSFGRYVNQTFEAFALAQTIKWYINHGWEVKCINPKEGQFRLKFSTRGRPVNFSFFRLNKNDQTIQIRHQLRVGIRHNYTSSANINLDLAVYKETDLTKYASDEFLPNPELISFGEAKHMSAYAELMANFVGLVHELMPEKLDNIRNKDGFSPTDHIPPFMIVSGILYRTAKELKCSIEDRGYDIDIYDYNHKVTRDVSTSR